MATMFGMLEARGGDGLGAKALEHRRSGKLAKQQHLDGDDAVEADLAGAVDDAHAAAGDLVEQFVVAEGRKGD